jgi:protein TonB
MELHCSHRRRKMFDKFIESGSEADQNSRRTYFLVSTVVVGILFLTGVIASIYAQEIGLGTDGFEISSLLTPVVPEISEPQPDRPQPERQQTHDSIPVRQAAIDRVAVSTKIPETTSVVPNTQKEMPYGRFRISSFDSSGITTSNSAGPLGPAGLIGITSRPTEPEIVDNTTPEPPPVIKKVPPTVSKGVVNGNAIDLPIPLYSKAAIVVGAVGEVTVQVLIDEKGNVISAKAVKGHPLLLQESELAARRAKFHPTKLSDVPVKVTGVITYRFSK